MTTMTSSEAKKTAADIMKRDVITVPGEATLQEAAALLMTHDISGAPVVDASGKMIGIVSESDLLSEAKRRSALPHIAPFGLFLVPVETLERVYHNGATLLVEEVMTKDVISTPPDMPLQKVGDLMIRSKINRLPVVDNEDNLLGIITREDLLRSLFHIAPDGTLEPLDD
jgi:CBS domain-containing protein